MPAAMWTRREKPDCMFVEQPLAYDDLAGLAKLTPVSPVPIGADEGIHSLPDIEAHEQAGVGGVSLKLIKLGGMRAAVEAAQLCAAARPRGEHRRQDRRIEHRLGRRRSTSPALPRTSIGA